VQLFGTGGAASVRPVETAVDKPAAAGESVHELARQADEHYAAAQAALQRGDWAAYGAEIEAVGQIIKQLVELTAPE